VGAALGGLAGAGLMLPMAWLPVAGPGLLLAFVRFTGLALVAGAGLGAAAGSVYAGVGRRWFWTAAGALGGLALLMLLAMGEIGRPGLALMVAGAVLAVAFGLWSLLAGALEAWRLRRR
jgi:hypothetical protein